MTDTYTLPDLPYDQGPLGPHSQGPIVLGT
jgi:hypothetical protein